MNYFLYLAVGSQKMIWEELYCSILSLKEVAAKKDFEIVIYTDRHVELGDELSDLKITLVVLDRVLIAEWLAESKFLLTLKPAIIKDFFKSRHGNVLLLDTDTFFVEDPLPLFKKISKGHFVMHLMENKVKKRQALKEFLSGRKFKLNNGKEFVIGSKAQMWNSGVVGISSKQAGLLDNIITFINQLCNLKRWHTNEQFAISWFFQNNGRIISAEKYIMHYWFFRRARFVVGYYFGVCEGIGKDFMRQAVDKRVVPEELQFKNLPEYVMKLFAYCSDIYDWHLYSLPGNTRVGRLLRRTLLTNKEFIVLWLKAIYKDILNRNNLTEIQKPEYDYK